MLWILAGWLLMSALGMRICVDECEGNVPGQCDVRLFPHFTTTLTPCV